MAESDSNFASSSSDDQQQNEESGIDEVEVRIRTALPYQDEPVAQVAAHTDDRVRTLFQKQISRTFQGLFQD